MALATYIFGFFSFCVPHIVRQSFDLFFPATMLVYVYCGANLKTRGNLARHRLLHEGKSLGTGHVREKFALVDITLYVNLNGYPCSNNSPLWDDCGSLQKDKLQLGIQG